MFGVTKIQHNIWNWLVVILFVGNIANGGTRVLSNEKPWRNTFRIRPQNFFKPNIDNEISYYDSFNCGIHPESYPIARRNESIYEKFFCRHNVSDPYRWMEDPNSEETKAYVRQLNAISKPFFEKSATRDKFREISLYRKKTLEDKGELFFDQNVLSTDGTISISRTSFSYDGKVMAYTISEKGSDVSTVKFRDHTGKDYKDEIPGIKHTSFIWSMNNKGIFYSKYMNHNKRDVNDLTSPDEHQALFYHRLGTNYKNDILLSDFKELNKSRISINDGFSQANGADDGRILFVYVSDYSSFTNVYYYNFETSDYDYDGPLELTLLFNDTKAYYSIVDYNSDTDEALFLSNNTIIKVNIGLGPDHRTTLIKAEENMTIVAATPIAVDKLMIQYLTDAKSLLYIYHVNGQLLYKIPLGIGDVNKCSAYKSDTEVIFQFSSFLAPSKYYRLDFDEVDKPKNLLKMTEIEQNNFQGIDTSNFIVKQEFYESKDGTKVPLYIIHNKDIVMDGRNPTILYGYGGFNIPQLPNYSNYRSIFIKHFRGVFAIANIRGGGEYGREWHERGTRENKQNVFDDFIAAAEYLIDRKYTSPKKLAIYGGSNGGLLVAACSQQRPELFGAVINSVGVLDMLRFHKFTVGSSWISEYGNPENELNFQYIYKYSPLHNVKYLPTNIEWPSTLLLTADHDDRVVPSHTYKYIATLYHLFRHEHKLLQRNPVLARVESDAGHGSGKSVNKIIDEVVDIISFLQRVLQMKWYD